MYGLPTEITINDKSYPIRNKADYRTILDIIAVCEDPDFTPQEQTLTALIIFYEGVDSIDDVFTVFNSSESLNTAVGEMMGFINCYDDNIGYKTKHKVIDWVQDEQMIISAINNVAKTEVRALDYLHWWTFISYYMAVGESMLSTVVGIRDKIAKGKKLDDFEKQFKRDNPQYFRWKKDDEQAKAFIETVWNKK